MNEEWLANAKDVFNGEATCCRLKHEGLAECDREKLIWPFLALHAQVHSPYSTTHYTAPLAIQQLTHHTAPLTIFQCSVYFCMPCTILRPKSCTGVFGGHCAQH